VATPVELRQRAVADLQSAVDQYWSTSGDDLALRFIDSTERALAHLGRHPLTGALRFSYELDIPELRAWPVPDFPYLVFYVATTKRVDVWRVLHTHRDIPSAFASPRD
jgi:toxin ParE1/3/4